jgi:hypothetical protein
MLSQNAIDPEPIKFDAVVTATARTCDSPAAPNLDNDSLKPLCSGRLVTSAALWLLLHFNKGMLT